MLLVAFTAGATFGQECERPGMDPSEACPVGTIYNQDTGACDVIMT